ncbi:hypothetical protein [Pararhodonellum marinum]|uniref:hypothetical protein n=1 Tax=Pararhodonellum marinum TaxID=2755358 RepID=UPI00293BBB73|nr:hypothetical protein [Pararhodonellum marinum]
MMDFKAFRASLSHHYPGEELPPHLRALWFDAKGNWENAHHCVDSLSDQAASHVHAYLHRKEGDIWNADYWYRRAGKSRPTYDLDEEWETLVRHYLQT